MNKFVIIIALALLLKPIMPVAGYIINYNYIANELCENKNNKALNCNGKCQLKKELAKASDSADSNTTGRKIKVGEQEVLFNIEPAQYLFFKVCNAAHNITDSYYNFYSYCKSSSVFRPPLLF